MANIMNEPMMNSLNNNNNEDDHRETKEERRKRRQEKRKLLEQLPKHDATGRAYNKGEIRKMLKRLSQGLDPIESTNNEQEEQHQCSDNKATTNNQEQVAQQVEIHKDEKQSEQQQATQSSSSLQEHKRFRCHKPVPEDYVCAACHNTLSNIPRHWIYDCPNKQSHMSSTKQNDNCSSDKKVFVSGLPFDATPRYIATLFEQQAHVKVVQCKILKFEDSKRCKGQAYVTLESAVDAQQVRKQLDGYTIHPQDTLKKHNEGNGSETDPSHKKVLRLKVTKVLNRNVTKKKQQQHRKKGE